MKLVDRALLMAAQRGWKQSQFARLLGLSDSRFSRWKSGEGEPTASQLRDMARILRVSADMLLSEDDFVGDPVPEGATVYSMAEQQAILITAKSLGLSVEEAIRRLASTSPEAGSQPRKPEVAVPIAVQTLEYEEFPAKSRKPSKR